VRTCCACLPSLAAAVRSRRMALKNFNERQDSFNGHGRRKCLQKRVDKYNFKKFTHFNG
jgi:hypothetical protein